VAAELSRANVVRVALVGRLFSLGGVFGKTVRDSRLAVVVVAGLLSLLLLVFGKFFAAAYPDAEARGQLTDLVASLPPALKGLTYGSGDPVKLDTLGGYISQDPGLLLKLIPGCGRSSHCPSRSPRRLVAAASISWPSPQFPDDASPRRS